MVYESAVHDYQADGGGGRSGRGIYRRPPVPAPVHGSLSSHSWIPRVTAGTSPLDTSREHHSRHDWLGVRGTKAHHHQMSPTPRIPVQNHDHHVPPPFRLPFQHSQYPIATSRTQAKRQHMLLSSETSVKYHHFSPTSRPPFQHHQYSPPSNTPDKVQHDQALPRGRMRVNHIQRTTVTN